MTGNANGWQFWIDRGGTFTDLVARRPDGSLHAYKLLSENPERYSDAAIQGIRDQLNIDQDIPIPDNLIDAVNISGSTSLSLSLLLLLLLPYVAIPLPSN